MDNITQSAFAYYSGDEKRDIPGLTKREYFAAKAMQGLLADPNMTNMESAARVAVSAADALLAELEK